MRTVLILAVGVWMGRKIYTTLALNQAREREVHIRKRLESFIRNHLPDLPTEQIQQNISTILKY